MRGIGARTWQIRVNLGLGGYGTIDEAMPQNGTCHRQCLFTRVLLPLSRCVRVYSKTEVDRIVALDAHLLRWEVDIYNPHIRIPFAFQLSKVAKPGSRLVGLVLKGCYCIFVP